MNRTSEPSTPTIMAADAYARRITAHLTLGNDDLPYEVTERLRAARMQALGRRKRAVAQFSRPLASTHATAAVGGNGHSSAILGGGGNGAGWWRALISAVPLAALAVGLVFVHLSQDEASAAEIAAVDAALLTDDLPPSAYTDPGFIQYLKLSAPSP